MHVHTAVEIERMPQDGLLLGSKSKQQLLFIIP